MSDEKYTFEKPDALKGFYSTATADADVVLYSGDVIVEHGRTRLKGQGEIVFCWKPYAAPEARISLEATADETLLMNQSSAVIIEAGSYRSEGLIAKCSAESRPPKSINDLKLVCRLQTSEHGQGAGLSSMLFHVANFDDVIGTGIGYERSFQLGRTTLEADGWTVILDNVEHVGVLIKEIDYSRGRGITHIGKLVRTDGSEFSSESAMDVLWALSHLLSFAMGHDVSAVLPAGMNNDGVVVWRQWNVPKLSSWLGPITWFNNQRPEVLRQLFEELLKQWKDADVRKAHQLALYWYLLAVDTTSPDSALVLAFTCLELIAWFWLVEKESLYTANNFDNKKTAEAKLRCLLARVGVPETIPPNLLALQALASINRWADGPEAIVALRHAAVHPKKRAEIFDAPERARDEALSLSLWYIELSILRFLGYNHKYINRLKRRTSAYVEMVPWTHSS